MGVDPKKLAAFANQKKPGAPFGKMGMKGKGPLQEWAKQEEKEPEHADAEGEGGKGYGGEGDVDVDAIGERVQSGNGDERLMTLAADVTEETNPPSSITDEDIWEKAKAAVEPRWEEYDEPYAVVMHVYEAMGGGFAGGSGSDEADVDEDEDLDEMDDGGGAA